MDIAPNRKALVTGGASGIGLEVARRLAASGATVALRAVSAGRRDAAAAEIGPAAIAVPADVRSAAAVRSAVSRAAGEMDGLDTLVACAGVIHVKPLAEVTEEDWDQTLDINLKG